MKLPKIQDLRQKSKIARNNIALGVAGTFTALLFAVWVFLDPAGIGESVTAVEADRPRVFGGLIDQFKEQVAGARQALEGEEQTPEPSQSPDIIMPPIPTEPEFNAPSSTVASSTPREVQLYIESEATSTSGSTQ